MSDRPAPEVAHFFDSLTGPEVCVSVAEDDDARRITVVLESLGYRVVRQFAESDGPVRLSWAVARLSNIFTKSNTGNREGLLRLALGRERLRVRARLGWRSFWGHRAEEFSEVSDFFDAHFGLYLGIISTAVVAGCVLLASVINASKDDACAGDCAALGAASHVRRSGCYCVDNDGRAAPWAEFSTCVDREPE